MQVEGRVLFVELVYACIGKVALILLIHPIYEQLRKNPSSYNESFRWSWNGNHTDKHVLVAVDSKAGDILVGTTFIDSGIKGVFAVDRKIGQYIQPGTYIGQRQRPMHIKHTVAPGV